MAADQVRFHALFLMEASDAMKIAAVDEAFCMATFLSLKPQWPGRDSSLDLQQQQQQQHLHHH